MEKIMSPDEKIRRAEEIYYKRKNQSLGTRSNYKYKEKKGKKSYSLFKKLIIQILVCSIIYVGVIVVKNSNYIFSEQFLNKVHEVLAYDIDLEKYYGMIMKYFNSEVQDSEENNIIVEEQNQTQENTTDENIGGSSEEQTNTQEQQNTENLSQMEIDSNDIKNTYSLIKPLEGTITSRFGQRDPTTPTVPKNHTGIDIAATTGTPIVAALDGIVELASSEGDYGKHLKIKKDNVELVYAHCSKLLKNEGEEVKQGEVIAEVGSTRKCNRPTFTF